MIDQRVGPYASNPLVAPMIAAAKEHFRENFFTVDGASLADGRYVFRVVASDVLDNPQGYENHTPGEKRCTRNEQARRLGEPVEQANMLVDVTCTFRPKYRSSSTMIA